MSPGNRVRLVTLADREYRQLLGKPAVPTPSRKFKPVRLNAARFDTSRGPKARRPLGHGDECVVPRITKTPPGKWRRSVSGSVPTIRGGMPARIEKAQRRPQDCPQAGQPPQLNFDSRPHRRGTIRGQS
jgi:hypothetical protein